MRAVLFLIFVPVIIGIIVGLFALPWSTFPWHSLWVFIKWIAILWLGIKVLGAIFPRSETPSEPQLLYPQRDTDLEQGHVEYVNKSTRILHADGYAFEMQNRDGRLHWREVDPTNKTPLERWTSAHPRDLRGEKRVMAESIKTRVNKRKGL